MNLSKKRIIVADDDIGILDAMRDMLDHIGDYEVTTVSSGLDLLKLNFQPDLIYLDLWMSGVNGSEICERLKANHKTKSVPVILFSANRDLRFIARSVGADDYLAKPFHLQELRAKTIKYLGA